MRTTIGKGLQGEGAASLEALGSGVIPGALSLGAVLSSSPGEPPCVKCPVHTVLKLTPVACGERPPSSMRRQVHKQVPGGPRATVPETYTCHSSCQGRAPKSQTGNLEART